MRTTVTIDNDLAVRLERHQAEEGLPFKTILNKALRIGLEAMELPAQQNTEFVRTQPLNMGRALIDITNVGEALAIAEGENYK